MTNPSQVTFAWHPDLGQVGPPSRAVATTAYNFTLAQRAFAAFWAISFLCSGDSFAARARPPLVPPSFPNATTAGFFLYAGNCTIFLAFKGAPKAFSTNLSAFCATPPLLERLR